MRGTILIVWKRREESHTLEVIDLADMPEPVCDVMGPWVTCGHMQSSQVPDPNAMGMNTIEPPLLAMQQEEQSCGGVQMFAAGVLLTTPQTTQTMNEITLTEDKGTQDATVMPTASGTPPKKKRN